MNSIPVCYLCVTFDLNITFVYIKSSVTYFSYINEIVNHAFQVKETKIYNMKGNFSHVSEHIADALNLGWRVFAAYLVREGGPAKHIRHG